MKERIIRAILDENLSIKWKDLQNRLNVHQAARQFIEVELDGFSLVNGNGECLKIAFECTKDSEINHINPISMEFVNQNLYRVRIPPLVRTIGGEWQIQVYLCYGYNSEGELLSCDPTNKLTFTEFSSIADDGMTVPNDADIANLYQQAKDGIEYLKGNVTTLQLNAELGAVIEFKNLEKGVEIDWGDGYRDFTIADNQTVGHTYEAAGNYTCRLYNITKVGENGFCSKYITRVVLADTISAVGYAAFLGDTALREVVLPNNLKYLGLKCFELCTSLKSIVIPESVINIGGIVFEQCANLRYVYMRSVVPPNLSANFGFVSNELTIIVPRESLEAYKTADEWSDYADKIDAFGFQGELMQGIPGLNALVYETIASCVTKVGNVVMYDLNGFNRTPLAGDCFTALLESSENSSVYAASLEVKSIRPADGEVDAVIKKLSWIRGGIEIVRLY